LKGSTSLDDATISKFNSLMALGNSDSALKLPILLSRVIWDGKVQDVTSAQAKPHYHTPVVVAQMATGFINATPKWLRYGEENIIRGDIEKLLAICFGGFSATNPA
jgi:hypothetical protein